MADYGYFAGFIVSLYKMRKPAFLLFFVLLSLRGVSQPATAEEQAPRFELQKLGKEINTGYHESGPLISPDGNTMYWVVSSHPANTEGVNGSQDIWFSVRDSVGNWMQAEHAGKPFNLHKINKVLGISTDGNTLMLNGGDKKNEPGFSIVRRTGSGWSDPVQMDIPGYEGMNKGMFSGSYMSNDAKVVLMYFTERVKGKYSDLYVSFEKNGKWSAPKKLPDGINSVYDEFGPFLAADAKTLYFASNRPGGLGSTDIYMAQRLDDSWMKWSTPVNLGEPVNTKGFDAYFSIDATGANAFTTRSYTSQDGGSLDIFALVPAKEEPAPEPDPDPVIILSGMVLNKKDQGPISGAVVGYQLISDVELEQNGFAEASEGDAFYETTLPFDGAYTLEVKAEGFMTATESIDVVYDGLEKRYSKIFYLDPIEVGTKVRLNNVFFDTDKTVLRSESFAELDKVVDFLNENASVRIEIGGHTDDVGSDDYNQRLSQGRAGAVRQYLIDNGIVEDRITAMGYGESQPEVPNDSNANRQVNRRVEFKILGN